MDWVQFADGQQAGAVRTHLDALSLDLENIRGRSAGLAPTVLADLYLRWVEGADGMLRDVFLDSEFVRGLYSERYWRIRETGDGAARPFPLVDGEIETQLKRLRQLSDQIAKYSRALTAPVGGVIAVLDTNVYVHYRRFTELPWATLLEATSVRLLVPLVVIDELDDLKTRGGKRGERAGGVIKAMRGLQPTANGSYTVRKGATTLEKHFANGYGFVGNDGVRYWHWFYDLDLRLNSLG